MIGKTTEVLLKEERVFEPPKDLVENSNIKKWMDKHGIKSVNELYEKAKDREWFWGTLAEEELDWFEKWDKVFAGEPPYFKWFTGAKTNIVHNALDRHMETEKENKLCYIWVGEPGDVRKLTYKDMHERVNQLANGLKSLGIGKGDSVGIYLPMIPELPIAMLACAKIGASHSVVFSGFSPKALRDRLNHAGAKALITCDGYYRKGKLINLKSGADDALEDSPSVNHSIVVDRTGGEIDTEIEHGRDIWMHELMHGQSKKCETEIMDSEDLLFLMYTSGTTGRPKGVRHTHGGYQVGISQTLRFVFDIKDNDRYWCMADIGWITGHSYIVYGPMILGTTSIMYEGAPTPEIQWKIIERYSITIFYTSPTAIRLFMKYGEQYPEKYDLSSLRLLGSVGEPINPEAWIWYYKHIGEGRCPIMDTWWQTETGNFIITPLPILPLKPGSATKPFPSIETDVMDDEGNPVRSKGGHLVIKTPWPSMLRGLHKEPDRYVKTYWSKFEGIYLTGDEARIDDDGYFWIQGREDDVLNVAGHRLSNSEIESALVSHKAVAEAAVVGKPDQIKGEVIDAFVILREGVKPSPELKKELKEHVSKEISPIARPSIITFIKDLPKTRSGKIMRRIIGSLVRGLDPGDITTLSNPESVDHIRKSIEDRHA